MSPPDGENHTFGFSANHTIGSVTPSDEMIGMRRQQQRSWHTHTPRRHQLIEQVTPPFCNVCRINKPLVVALWSGGHGLTYGVETVAYISADGRHPQEEAPHEPPRWREPHRGRFRQITPLAQSHLLTK